MRQKTLKVLQRVSMSKSALLLSGCLAWAHPTAQWYDESRVAKDKLEKRDNGTLFHTLIHCDIRGIHRPVTDNERIETLATMAKEWVDTKLRPRLTKAAPVEVSPVTPYIMTEQAVAVNWVTGDAKLIEVVDRDYPDMPGYQMGTADLVCWLDDRTIMVLDWKTGGTEAAEAQLLSLGYGFKKALNATKLIINCFQLGFDETGVPFLYPHEREVSDDEIEEHRTAMQFQWEDIEKANRPRIGIHCTTLYCNHLAYCKGINSVVESLARDAGKGSAPMVAQNGVFDLTDKPCSDAEAGYVMERLSAADRQIKYLKDGMKEYVAKGGRVISGDWEWSEGNNGFRWRKIK